MDKDVAKGNVIPLYSSLDPAPHLTPPPHLTPFLLELESEVSIINWSAELVDAFASKLYPLWNRTAGDCLLDSVLQATWGVVDRDSTLRRSMADSLVDGASRCEHLLVNMVVVITFLFQFLQSLEGV